MRHKVVTLCNSEYFKYGKLFLKTRDRIDADFVLYGSNLTNEQIDILKSKSITYKKIPKNIFDSKMQSLKFSCMADQTTDPENSDEIITFVDFDIEFIKDWNPTIQNEAFDFGITIRKDMIKDKCYRAFANGGVIFARNCYKSLSFLNFASEVIFHKGHKLLSEYDEIFKTLESKDRPRHKRHHRDNFRCWTDQVFLSAVVKNCLSRKSGIFRLMGNDTIIQCFPCEVFNSIGEIHKNTYIHHLKQEGRLKLSGVKENLLGA